MILRINSLEALLGKSFNAGNYAKTPEVPEMSRTKCMRCFAGIYLICMLAGAIQIASAEDDAEYGVFGNWGGVKPFLVNHGITVDASATTDLVSVLDGGLKRDTKAFHEFDLTTLFDTEQARLWPGGTVFVYFVGSTGEAPSAIVGDSQGTSDIEAPESAKLYQAGYEHQIPSTETFLLVGLHDYSDDFNNLQYSSVLLNSGFVFSPDISQIGASVFPDTGLAARLRARPSAGSYALIGIYEGMPGDPQNPRGTHIHLSRKEGAFYALELGIASPTEKEEDEKKEDEKEEDEKIKKYGDAENGFHETASAEDLEEENDDMTDAGKSETGQADSKVTVEESYENHYKAGIGGWILDGDFVDAREIERSSNMGFYLIGETALRHGTADSGEIGGFVKAGWAEGDRNEFSRFFGAGLAYRGFLQALDDDSLTVAVYNLTRAMSYRKFDPESPDAENVVELSYRFTARAGLVLQPDLQYVIFPGGATPPEHSFLATVRIELTM